MKHLIIHMAAEPDNHSVILQELSKINVAIAVNTAETTHVKESVEEIKVQTQKTNGSVADLKKWRERWTGAVYVIIALLLPFLSWQVTRLIDVAAKVDRLVGTLSSYNIQVDEQK